MGNSNSTPDLTCNSYSEALGKNITGVCVCTVEKPCPTISNDYLTIEDDESMMFTTSRAGLRLAPSSHGFSTNEDITSSNADYVMDVSTEYQTIIGFGGAMTDATAINVYAMDEELQDKIIDHYYGSNGIQYTTGRIPIASTDFSTSIYSYNDVDGDLEMENFSIDIDREPTSHKLSLIHRILKKTSRELSLFASSWAPPAWMTEEQSTLNCHLKGEPGNENGEYWQALALYYSKFLKAYIEDEGIPIWGMTTQNEPHDPGIHLNSWQSLRFSTETERDFIKYHLGPMLKENHPEVKLIMLDDNKNLISDWRAAMEDKEAAQYVSGLGIHWYSNYDFVLSTDGNFDDVADFHEDYPDVFILGTEACEGYILEFIGTGSGVQLDNYNRVWWRARNYALDIVGDLQHFASGWTDWNLVLDAATGGPNWAKNFVTAPILTDTQGGSEYYLHPIYFVMGQFSKFLPAGSKRIGLKEQKSRKDVYVASFVTPDDQYVTILFNDGDSAVDVSVWTPKDQALELNLAANGVHTVIFNA